MTVTARSWSSSAARRALTPAMASIGAYPGIISAAGNLPCRAAILDGEVIVQNERGVSDFEALRSAIRWQPHKLLFYAFDVLHLDGEDLRDHALVDRRATLRELIGRDRSNPLQFSDEFTGDSAAFFRACAEHGLEGVVSKLASSRYRSGRSKMWLKTKCFTESELTLLGVDRDRKTGAPRALLAKRERGELNYAGPAFFALRGEEREQLNSRMVELAQNAPSLSWLKNRKAARWVRPEITVKVKHLAGARLLRHATVRELADR